MTASSSDVELFYYTVDKIIGKDSLDWGFAADRKKQKGDGRPSPVFLARETPFIL